MTAQKRTTKRTNTAAVRKKPAVTSAKTPAKSGAVSAPPRAKAAASGRARASAVARPGAGDRLRTELTQPGDSYGVTVLINQAARVADRLDVLDKLLSGHEATWVKLDPPRVIDTTDKIATIRVDVRIDSPILEERQQTTVLRHLLSEIHKQRAGIPGNPGDDDDVMEGL